MRSRLLIVLLELGLLTLASLPVAWAGEPCCNITNIAGSLVTANDTASGKTFQFQVTDPALLKSLRVGQKVYADFGTQKVSVDGAAPCCAILSASGGPAGSATLPGVNLPSVQGARSCCAIVANAALKGRLGRVVVAFPAAALPKGTRVAVLRDGKEVKAGHGTRVGNYCPARTTSPSPGSACLPSRCRPATTRT